MTHSQNNRSADGIGEGTSGSAYAPERPKSLPLSFALDLDRRVTRFASNIADAARALTGLTQDGLSAYTGRTRVHIAKQESDKEPGFSATLVDALKGPSAYAIGLISGVLEARAKLYPNEPAYMLVPIAPAIIEDDEQTLTLTATRENAEVIFALANPNASAREKTRELRESIEADTRLAAFLQAKCA